MDFDTDVLIVIAGVFGAAHQVGRHLRLVVQPEHLFDLDPTHGHGLDRQAKSVARRGQCHLGETRCGHHGLAVHLVIRQPRDEPRSDVRLPHMITAGRHLNVRAQQRMGTDRLPVSG